MLTDEQKTGNAQQAPSAPESAFTFSKDAVYGTVIAVLACMLVISIFTAGFGVVKAQGQCVVPDDGADVVIPDTSGTDDGNDDAPALPSLTVEVGELPAEGSEGADVIIVEFSDYQCPYCSRFYDDAEAAVRSNYVESGKVRIYFRDYPLSFHPNALPAAIAARCADDQGKFWEMHDKLFETQSSWSGMPDAGPTFKQYATEIGMDTSFATCYDSKAGLSAINADFSEGQTYGVRGTPSSFIVVPKSMISREVIDGAMATLVSQYGDGITLFEDSTTYSVMIPGAYPYAAFDAVLSKISY